MRSTYVRIRRLVPTVASLSLITALYTVSREPTLPGPEADLLARRFRFESSPLSELPGYTYERKVRAVHPSLHHVRSWISFVGAAVALADLDGDGLPNDVVHVDPRIDRVVVSSAPGTGDRFAPFTLEPSPLPIDRATMAPMGSRVGDFDEDGYTDILVYYWGRSPILFLQRPGLEARSTVALTPATYVPRELVEPYQVWFTSAVGQADLDGDGHIDLLVGNYSPDGRRVLDPDGTGREEMMDSMSRAYNGGEDRLFLWRGSSGPGSRDVNFREATGVFDPEVSRGWTFAIGIADIDGDLLPEVYLVQDFGPDRLLHNRSRPGDPHFTLLRGLRGFTTPRSLVLGADSFNGMGVDLGDLDGDGVLDIFVSNITSNNGLHESNFVFRGNTDAAAISKGVAPFEDVSEKLGLARGGWTWDAKFADFDNDGVLEVMQAGGFTKGSISRWPEAQELTLGNDQLTHDPRFLPNVQPGDDIAGQDHNPFFVRSDDRRYYDIAGRIGLGTPMLSRGIAPADIDGDGRVDFAVANNWERSLLFHNTAPAAGSYLGLHLRLPLANDARSLAPTAIHKGHPQREIEGPSLAAIGASVTVRLPGGRRLVAQVDGGNGHSGQRPPDLHFGLGRIEPSQTLTVELRWRGRDGRIREQQLELEPDHWYSITLGEPCATGGSMKR